MKLLVTGVSHKTAPVEIRECLAFPEPALPQALQSLKSRGAVSEACILSTCNRVEITVTTEDAADPQSLVDGFLQESRLAAPASIGPYLYRHQGQQALQPSAKCALRFGDAVGGLELPQNLRLADYHGIQARCHPEQMMYGLLALVPVKIRPDGCRSRQPGFLQKAIYERLRVGGVFRGYRDFDAVAGRENARL